MLVHQLRKAEREVVEAEAAVELHQQLQQPMKSKCVIRAKHKVHERVRNLAWQKHKIHQCDVNGLAVFDMGEPPHEFSQKEFQWNLEIAKAEKWASNSHDNAPADAPADAVLQEPSWAAARFAPPAAWTAASSWAEWDGASWTAASEGADWYRAIEKVWPADAAACAAAVAPQASDSKEPPIEEDSTGRVQAFTRKPQEQAHAAASDSSGASAGSGAPLPEAIDAVASAFASAVGEAPAANMPTKVNEDVALPLAAVGEAPAANMPTKVNEDVALPLAEERPRHIPPPFVRPSSCCWCM
jgi:hypothetical protein